MQYPHWSFYLAIMEDLNTVIRYVEPCEANFTTYSIELSRILLAVGAEVDVVAHQLSSKVAPHLNAQRITDYQKALTDCYPKMPSVQVSMERHALIFRPWESWGTGNSPDWWRSYNNVKHRRHECFHEANLGRVLEATAGLCVLVVYMYHELFEQKNTKRPLLFVDRQYDAGGHLMRCVTYRMPDFRQ